VTGHHLRVISVCLVLVLLAAVGCTEKKPVTSAPSIPPQPSAVRLSIAVRSKLGKGDFGPGRLAVDSERGRLWISMSCPGRCPPGDQVWLLDGRDLKVLKRVKVDTRCSDSQFAPAMALDAESGSLIVGSCQADRAFVVDGAGNVRRMTAPRSAEFTVVDGALIALRDPVEVIDLGTGRVRARFRAGGVAIEAVRHDQSLFLLHGSVVTEVDIAKWQVRRTIKVPVDGECMAVYSDSLFITRGGSDEVVIVAVGSEPSRRTVHAPADSCHVMVDPSRRAAYMSFDAEAEWGLLAMSLPGFREQARLPVGASSVGWTGLDVAHHAVYAEVAHELVKVNIT